MLNHFENKANGNLNALFGVIANTGIHDLDKLVDSVVPPAPEIKHLRFQSPEEALAGRVIRGTHFALHRLNKLGVVHY